MKFNFKKNNKGNFKKGMSYVELIVVISIFFIMSAVVLVRNNDFEKRIEVQNLTNQIALKIVQTQKDALSGIGSTSFFGYDLIGNPIKPSYGIYFNINESNNSFIYFADYDNSGLFEKSNGEMIGNKIEISKGNKIEGINASSPDCGPNIGLKEINIVFKRPDSMAIIRSGEKIGCTFSEAVINFSDSTNKMKGIVRVFSSGRVQIK